MIQKRISALHQVVHRLDRNTSGLVIFGKDMRALQDLNTMMKTRQGIEKKYLTIAMGHMKDATLSGYVKKNEDEGKMYLVKKDTPGALSMKTIVHVLKKMFYLFFSRSTAYYWPYTSDSYSFKCDRTSSYG